MPEVFYCLAFLLLDIVSIVVSLSGIQGTCEEQLTVLAVQLIVLLSLIVRCIRLGGLLGISYQTSNIPTQVNSVFRRGGSCSVANQSSYESLLGLGL